VWIVRLALRNPLSVAVFSLVILIMGVFSAATMLVDIFPVIDLPVVAVVWSFPGLTAQEVEERIVTVCERAFSTTVSGISRIESQSIPGTGNIRVYFQPGTEMGTAVSQISATSEVILRILPPGITPPNILPFNASNVPVAQLTVSGKSLTEFALFDYSLNFIRLVLFTVPGLSTPAPYGGATRQINVDVDPALANSRGVSAQDVVNTLQSSNLIIPAGDARLGPLDYNVTMNASPGEVAEFSRMPIKVVGNRPVTIGDVAKVEDAAADQTNIVRINGQRATFLNILKKADASTLDVVNSARRLIPRILSTAPKGMELKLDFDQSVFVKAAVTSVVREAVLAAALVATMVLFFLGSLRSVLIVCSSIPLSILVGLMGLKLSGETLNIMTLGGLSLAIGMLVDDATVEIENIDRNLRSAPSTTVAVLRGAHQIALPAIVSTLAICIVFFPIVLLTGAAKFLFTPMAEAVVYSMLASYVLSRTLVPVMARKLIHGSGEVGGPTDTKYREGWGERFNERREQWFERVRQRYARVLSTLVDRGALTLGIFCALFAVSLWLPLEQIGQDFFPSPDAGIMKFHFRAPTGTRLEETEKIIAQVEQAVRRIVPEDELSTINSNIGVPIFYNLAFVPTDNVGQMDAEILVALKPDHHPTAGYQRKLRESLSRSFPGSIAYFQSADIVNQVLNFGLTSPVDVQIESRDVTLAYSYARKLRDKVRQIPGAVDIAIRQVFDYPTLEVNVDRLRAAQIGISQKDVASNLLNSLSSSFTVSPSFYINPSNQVQYPVVVKVPLPKINSTRDLTATPITAAGANPLQQAGAAPGDLGGQPGPPVQTVGNVSTIIPQTLPNQVTHVDVQRVIDVLASVDGRDLGSVVSDIEREIRGLGKLPAGVRIRVRGQNEVMRSSFRLLGLGMILAIVLVYLLMVTLFQSWLDPFIIMVAVPGALIGIFWMLALSGTTINVVSLMGSIMAIGIAVSNSNLMVTFANDIRVERNLTPAQAAVEAGKVRLRPVIMTALAMILGMLPTALGLGEGGEQNAPLGKAVIGGLLVATATTLALVPVIYALVRKAPPTKHRIREEYRKEEMIFDEELRHAEQS
jgi:multidrug efflux pump subunit AcrB